MSEKSESDVEILQENICHYGGDNLLLSKKRKKHSSKKKKKKKRQKRNHDDSITLVDLVSDSESDEIELQEKIASKNKLPDSNKKSLHVKDMDNSNNLISSGVESTVSGRNVECRNIIKKNVNENEDAIIVNKTVEIVREKQNIDKEELQKYIGNISDVDFSDMEMDIEVSQESLILVDSQNAASKFTEKKKNSPKNTFCDPKKFWLAHFDVEDDCSEQTSQNIKTSSKSGEVQNKNNALCTGLHNEYSKKNVGLVNTSTLTKSMSQTKFSMPKESADSTSILKPNLPMTIDANGNKVFRFFWWDAYEAYKPPGVVYLFGKVYVEKTNDFKSCCVAVRNILRRIYLLPKKIIQTPGSEFNEPNVFENVYNDVNEYLRKIKVNEFKFRKVTKMYCFDKKDVPENTTYYEVRYSALHPAIEPNYSSSVIQAVFETSMSPLELFLIEKKIKGPCWLDLKISHKEPNKYSTDFEFSWCEIEANCFKMEEISVSRYKNNEPLIPSVVVAALYVQVSLDYELNRKEVINIVILLNHKFQLNKSSVKPSFDQSYCLVTHPQKLDWPKNALEMLTRSKKSKVMCCKDELELLEKLLEILEHSNPDILVSYDSKFQLEVLVDQITTLKVKDWSRIGKLKCFQPPYFKDRIYLDQLFCGRPFCDIQTSIKELKLKITNNDLLSLCSAILHKGISKCKDINPEDCPSYYESVEKLESLIRSTMIKAFYVLEIALELNVLQLAVEQTRIVGNTLSRTFAAGVSERNEYLLLHAFHDKNYVIPEKRKGREDPNKKSFSGGMVLEPVRGFYDSLVLVMDFNSLYPNIIVEFNICFTTIPAAICEDFIDFNPPHVNLRPGVLPIEMEKLIEKRDQLKKSMRSQLSEDLKFQYNIKQLALKLTANSVYGCLGAPYSRFYSIGLAAFITYKGREILQKTVNIVESLGYKVIYGDTDSIMIQTKFLEFKDAIALGKYIKQTVNKSHKKIELDIDAVFKYLLLLMKKQYAAILITKSADGSLKLTKEIKGLEIIKRNYCSLACDTGNQILDQILRNHENQDQRTNNILEILKSAKQKLQEGTLPLSSLEIVKQFSKDPSKYHSSQVSSHAIVAQRLNKHKARKWQAGDIMSYIICKDETNRNPGERAYHVTEINANSALQIDADYYLTSQIYPVVSKLCAPIEGIQTQLIAEILGVQKSKVLNNQNNTVPISIQKNHFEECLPFEFYCQSETCKSLNQVKTVLVERPTGFQPSLAVCSNLMCDLAPFKYAHYIQNKLQLDIRKCITQYYKSELKCDSQLCLKVCESVDLDSSSNILKCHRCFDGFLHRNFTESDLFNQLRFFLYIFTLKDRHLDSLSQKPSDDLLNFYNKIKEFILDEIDNSAYNVVDLTQLFNPNVKGTESDVNDPTKYTNLTDQDF